MAYDFPIKPLNQVPLATTGLATVLGVGEDGGIRRGATAFVNIMDYMADGRVEGTTDDTAAWLAARTAAGVDGGVMFPMGRTFVIDKTTIALPTIMFSPWGAVIKRKSDAALGTWLNITASSFKASGITFDGNKAVNSNACHNITIASGCHRSEFRDCEFKNAKANAGYGSGLLYNAGHTGTDVHKIINCTAHDNDEHGLSASDVNGLHVKGGEYYSNTENGLFLNNYDLTFTQKILASSVKGAHVHHNGGSGIGVGNYVQDNVITSSVRLYGFTNNEAQGVEISGNTVEYNLRYGIAAYGLYIWVDNNTIHHNGNGGTTFGGVNFVVKFGSCSGNNIYLNDSYGLDAGSANNVMLRGNTIRFNCQAADTAGVTLEGCVQVDFCDNTVIDNGGTTCTQIYVWRHGGDGGGNWFPTQVNEVNIKNNSITCANSRIGVRVRDGADGVNIENNHFFGAINSNFISYYGDLGTVSNNKFPANNTVTLTPDAADCLPVPDGLELAYVSSTTILQGIQYTSQRAIGSGIPWVEISAGGSGYVAASTTVSFSGGGGSGAAGTAIVYNGAVIGVRMTSPGTGYTSAPTVAFADTGGGTGATGTAQWKLPLQSRRGVEIQFAAATTVKRSGTAGPVVNSPAAADITIAADNFIRLSSAFNAWYLAGKNF